MLSGVNHSARAHVGTSPAVTSMVVFTAVDGILRASPIASCRDARLGIELLSTRSVPVVLFSQGAAAPVQELQQQLGLTHPFICEGGARLYIPRGYFAELDGLSSGDEPWEVFSLGAPDAARPVRLLASLYRARGDEVMTVGFGCTWNDRTLLSAVDVPVIVRQEGGDQMRLRQRVPGAYVTEAVGPAGWSEAVLGTC